MLRGHRGTLAYNTRPNIREQNAYMRRHKPDYTKADYTLPTIDKKRKWWQSLGFLRRHPEAPRILVASIIAVVVGVQLSIIFTQVYNEYSELIINGSRAIGTVVETRVEHNDSTGAGQAYQVYYTFSTPSGVQFKGGGPVEYQLWQKLDVGSSIEIAFDPVDPSKNLPVAADRPGVWMAYFGAVVFAWGAFLVVRFVLLPLVIWSVKKLILIFRWYLGSINCEK